MKKCIAKQEIRGLSISDSPSFELKRAYPLYSVIISGICISVDVFISFIPQAIPFLKTGLFSRNTGSESRRADISMVSLDGNPKRFSPISHVSPV